MTKICCFFFKKNLYIPLTIVLVCITPDYTEGGNVNISDDGSTAVFTCDSGYTMVGEQTLTCATDGSGWDISKPSCSTFYIY